MEKVPPPVLPLWTALVMIGISGLLQPVEKLSYRLLGTIPHRQENFTQGLLYHGGYLYESTGKYGKSSLKKIDPANGRILKKINLTPGYFGEGLALHGQRLVQLTWVSEKALVYNLEDFHFLGTFRYPGEGWGLTTAPEGFVMSNGSDCLWLVDFDRFQFQKRIRVTFRGRPLPYLNELEYVDGLIYANVLTSPRIYGIDPQNGKVQKLLDLTVLVEQNSDGQPDTVLNGLAYDPAGQRWYVTGKNWPRIYILKLENPLSKKDP